jgi:hypothetical protein
MTPLPDRCVAPVPVEKKVQPDSPLEQNLKSVLETRTAGDPDDATLVCTDLSPARLSVTMAKMAAIPAIQLATALSASTKRSYGD